jgi:mannitol-1-phosphate 5-dehydrogenase
MRLVVFGAGNIGRSFVGQLFSRAGYQVVFVDVDDALVAEIVRRGRYLIEVREGPAGSLKGCPTIWVEGVSAIHARDEAKVAEAVADADMVATAVGQTGLPRIFPALAQGLQVRYASGKAPLDILICENLREAAGFFRSHLQELLPPDFPLDTYVGLVETSIGKMVPIMPAADKERDRLLVYAEAYNTLPVDAKAFRSRIPDVPGLDPKQNMAAHVDRKTFIHNLGHAACAYVVHVQRPELRYIWEAVRAPEVLQVTRAAMWESARGLIRRYPDEFSVETEHEHIEDLLARFGNQALGDTVFRVGRDLPRKLSREDRLVGALLMDAAEHVAAPATALALACAFFFQAVDEDGRPFPADAEFSQQLAEKGLDWALTSVCGLRREVALEGGIMAAVRDWHSRLLRRSAGWLTAVCRSGVLRPEG